MENNNFRPGDKCRIIELGQGGFHFEARESFAGKNVEFVEYCDGSSGREGFISCQLRLLEDIYISEESHECLLEGFEFYFPCVRIK